MKLRVHILIMSILSVALFSCSDENDLSPEDQLAEDIKIIEEYVASNNLNATKTESGLHYIVREQGHGNTHPTLDSEVEVLYKGYFTSGSVFDRTETNKPVKFKLKQVIKGWQEGIQLMVAGEEATFVIPSALAYGNVGSGNIPPNTVLVFDVELLGFK